MGNVGNMGLGHATSVPKQGRLQIAQRRGCVGMGVAEDMFGRGGMMSGWGVVFHGPSHCVCWEARELKDMV